MTRACTEEIFLKDVADHTIEILQDNHVYRHLRFRKPGTYCMGFDVVTYPGYLCYSGDMGSFVFSRIHDMICFFRGKADGPLQINPHYWSEKIDAEDRRHGYENYSADKFRAHIADELKQFREHIERDIDPVLDDDDDVDDQKTAAKIDEIFTALKSAVTSDLLSRADDGEYAVYSAMRDFEHADRNWFQDSWEVNFREYTYHFIWCCFALVWAIRKYDQAKSDAQKSG